jgi:hypothetical protein
MPVPVKVSDRLLALAKEEGRGTHRSATAPIEHWATSGLRTFTTSCRAEVAP